MHFTFYHDRELLLSSGMLIYLTLFSRSTRESTPCSLIRGVDVATPGSSTRQKTANAVNRRGAILDNVPSSSEIEEFFASADQCQRRQFIEKYVLGFFYNLPYISASRSISLKFFHCILYVNASTVQSCVRMRVSA